MGKHGTEYARIERDLYPTAPSWPVAALAEHVELRGKTVWEFACGTGDMAASLRAEGATVFTSDDSRLRARPGRGLRFSLSRDACEAPAL